MVIATPSRADDGVANQGTRVSGVMARFFSCGKILFLAFFLKRMVRHLGFTMETTVYHGPQGRPFHIIAERSSLPRRKVSALHRKSYYEQTVSSQESNQLRTLSSCSICTKFRSHSVPYHHIFKSRMNFIRSANVFAIKLCRIQPYKRNNA